jgi:hypothetical protein
MRLSGYVVGSLFFLSMSAAVLCQHSSGGGGYSGVDAGGYSGVSSSGSSSHGGGVSSAGSLGGSHSSSYVPSSGRTKSGKTGSNVVRSNEGARVSNTKPEKRGFFGFHCRKGQDCGVCRRTSTCIVETSCASGLVWNGFSCGPANYYWNDCREIANELATMRAASHAGRQMQGQNDPGMNLTYEMLAREYRSCMARYGGGSLIADANWFDIP